ncbi:hypothetical protein POSPLADRAFT_1032096 [Postia placenta MAD-698-R-SB12]|uniref:SAP domain-containing protein n=1 Tax=Postia placenta MAD-698-R-SB12 TaxID=670580 RepID=A0A1X6N9G2_9APHY|nr:hypothetical protein POSPLADRAFT_1032096 [Postia placenta MAD-698-R-SB12]OSX65288.1 hypothetical protein POSPLADRAFT_1032096 [Postia placenta MAD-698-R-SB12]
MLRTALRAQLRPATTLRSRGFVSTVLLTKAWENEPLNDLKEELKRRGLSHRGNKATLVTRLRTDDKAKSLAPAPSSVSPQAAQQVRHASTTEVPGVPSAEAPPPLPKTYPKQFLDVKMPDFSQPDSESPIQIPFLPDLWDSSRIQAESAPKSPSVEEELPKMVAVAGSVTHHGGGPTYNLSNTEADDLFSSSASHTGPSGFWRDVAEDLNLPTSLNLPNAANGAKALFDIAEKTETSSVRETSHSRTLDSDEKKGVWVLLSLLGGSWLAAGFLQPTPAFAENAAETAEAKVDTH